MGFDTSVIINFCVVGRLGLLVRCVPPPRYLVADVRDELEDHNSRRLVDRLIDRRELFIVVATESTGTDTSMSGSTAGGPGRRTHCGTEGHLGRGELATLAAAAARGWSVAVDELPGRMAAARRVGSARVTGTVGILRAAVGARLITPRTGDVLLTRMIRAGYYSPVASLDGSAKRRRASSTTRSATAARSHPRVSVCFPGSSIL
jgi:predicted nucleic acid-binding protein